MTRKSIRQVPNDPADQPDGASPAAESAVDAAGAEADQMLVGRCVAGEVGAWEELYRQCHEPLCVSIKSLLSPRPCDANVIDEIAARVWYALVKDDGRLLERFDPCRDVRLGGFFRGLARIEIMRYFRAEHRRCDREVRDLAARRSHRQNSPLSLWEIGAILRDFSATLTRKERRFLEDYVLAQPDGGDDAGPVDPSDSRIWQRCRRIRMKLRAFFADGL